MRFAIPSRVIAPRRRVCPHSCGHSKDTLTRVVPQGRTDSSEAGVAGIKTCDCGRQALLTEYEPTAEASRHTRVRQRGPAGHYTLYAARVAGPGRIHFATTCAALRFSFDFC